MRRISDIERRWFGVLFGLFGFVTSTLLQRRITGVNLQSPVLSFVAVVIVVYYLKPSWQLPIYGAWLKSVEPVGWIMSRITLFLVFYGLVTPIGMLIRLGGHDALRLRRTSLPSYWLIRKERERKSVDYFRQF